ncbi:rRNA (guanine-N1)-methyltransferase [Arthrobacter tumbae]|uniref:methyltransferase domain-containing protein n=1 Tax=Arthrobacter tumbae TaxID=163874 RepID=UPI001EF9A81B|nr:methyltransferase domain-containing protein [Arthrobacter tumbae]MBM7783142.1 23S rRNA (guanine745-N1)-methyltransferase [Arthrobacter tumbae]
MVQARIDFLEKGHFEPLANAVIATAQRFSGKQPLVLDVGAGTGYYLNALQEQVSVSAAVALDISKYALRRSARLLPDALCLVCDVWRPLPVAGESVDLLLNIFAPRNVPEFARVCRDEGVALVVTPLPHHLREIAEPAGLLDIRPGKDIEVAASMADFFDVVDNVRVEFTMALSPVDVSNVATMGPAGHHNLPGDVDPLPHSADTTAAFSVQVFRRRPRTRD